MARVDQSNEEAGLSLFWLLPCCPEEFVTL